MEIVLSGVIKNFTLKENVFDCAGRLACRALWLLFSFFEFEKWLKMRISHWGKQQVTTLKIREFIPFQGGARSVIVIVAGIGHGDTSSNPGLIAFHIALIPLGTV